MSSFIHPHIPLPRPFLSISEPLLRLPGKGEVQVPSSRGKLLYFLSGEALLAIDDQPSVLVREGSLAILPRPCLQTYRSVRAKDETLHAYCIRFLLPKRLASSRGNLAQRDLTSLMMNTFQKPMVLTDGVTASIRQKILLLRQEMEEKIAGHEAMLYAIILNLCIETARSVGTFATIEGAYPGKRKARNLINGSLEYMLRHLQQNPSVEKVAWAMNVSAEHLCRIFRTEKGMTPREALRSLQMNEAKNLLLHSSLEIYRIAERAGFGSVTTFCRFFKKHSGATPSEYRFANPEQFIHRFAHRG